MTPSRSTPPRPKDGDAAPREGERIAKLLARAGLCSRREGEAMIAEGRVSVDGRVLESPAVNVSAASVILVDGKPLPEVEPTRLWLYHKPTGLVTTHKDEQGRPTVFDKLKKRLPRVISVGRLDLNSEGLLLLTNDGALARALELPTRGWVRRYRVRVLGAPGAQDIAALAQGITVDGMTYGPISVTLDTQTGRNSWLTVSLSEGKNREIRRVMEHIGLQVNRLIRISFGPFHLGRIARGEFEEVPRRQLHDALGNALSAGDTPKVGRAGWAKAKPKAKAKVSSRPKPRNKPSKPRKANAKRRATHQDPERRQAEKRETPRARARATAKRPPAKTGAPRTS